MWAVLYGWTPEIFGTKGGLLLLLWHRICSNLLFVSAGNGVRNRFGSFEDVRLPFPLRLPVLSLIKHQ